MPLSRLKLELTMRVEDFQQQQTPGNRKKALEAYRDLVRMCHREKSKSRATNLDLDKLDNYMQQNGIF